jgi:hypothetical protein
MGKRDPNEYLRAAEADIDTAWQRLELFQSDRPSALLKLVTAADDRMRIAAVTGLPFEAQFAIAVRYAQEGLNFAVRWIYRQCTKVDSSIPEFVAETDEKQGMELLDYGAAYDTAVIAFTNFHEGRFQAFIAAKDPRITFKFESEQADIDETAKRAYELAELGSVPPEWLSDEALRPLRELLSTIPSKAERETGDRVRLRTDDELVGSLRVVSDFELRINAADIPDHVTFDRIQYGDIRRYRAALAALCLAHEFLHVSDAVREIGGGAVSSLAFRMSLDELNKQISLVSALDLDLVARLSETFKFDGSISNLDPACQPLLLANDRGEVIVPRAYSKATKWERNFLKLIAKNPQTKAVYDAFSSTKEEIALATLVPFIKRFRITVRPLAHISAGGKEITDVDLLLYDPRDRLLLVTQHKWLIEPDTVNESKACDAELQKGIRQAALAKAHLADVNRARELIPEIPAEGFTAVEGLVISRGLEPTGFVKETDIPVVTEKWFKENLASAVRLSQLFERAKVRPDREQLAQEWKSELHQVNISGYRLLVPAMSKIVRRD